jgi:hypothetical protein
MARRSAEQGLQEGKARRGNLGWLEGEISRGGRFVMR